MLPCTLDPLRGWRHRGASAVPTGHPCWGPRAPPASAVPSAAASGGSSAGRQDAGTRGETATCCRATARRGTVTSHTVRTSSPVLRASCLVPHGVPLGDSHAGLGYVVRGGGLPPQRPRCRRPGTRRTRPASLLPQRRQGEWLGEQHLTELATVHRDRGPGIERPTQPLLRHLAPGGANTACHLADRPTLRQADL